MITDFEEYTMPLSPTEIRVAEVLANAFNTIKKGKEYAITAASIQIRLSSIGIKADDNRIRKCIHYIRTNNLVYGLCSCKNGFFVAVNKKEYITFMKSLEERISAQTKVYNSIKRQCAITYPERTEQSSLLCKPLI